LFCSYDARNGGPDNGRRWSDEERGFGDRAHFQLHRHPSVLHVEKIEARESGIYRCRVDFKTAPTRNSLLNLTVIGKSNFLGLGRACKMRAWVRFGFHTAGLGFCGPGLVCGLGARTAGLAQKPGPHGIGFWFT
jgi:hypothetical protein